MVFFFGLLHGLGFAGVLAETPLVEGQRLAALLLFNLGVEFGQVAVLAAAFVLSLPFKDPRPLPSSRPNAHCRWSWASSAWFGQWPGSHRSIDPHNRRRI